MEVIQFSSKGLEVRVSLGESLICGLVIRAGVIFRSTAIIRGGFINRGCHWWWGKAVSTHALLSTIAVSINGTLRLLRDGFRALPLGVGKNNFSKKVSLAINNISFHTFHKTFVVGANSRGWGATFLASSAGIFHKVFCCRIVGSAAFIKHGVIGARLISKDGFFGGRAPGLGTVVVGRQPVTVGAVKCLSSFIHPVRSEWRSQQTNNLLASGNVWRQTDLGVQDTSETTHLDRGGEHESRSSEEDIV
jgi:hypothetical protein